jgi:hypothetical protein
MTPEERQRLWLEMAHGPCCCLVCPSPGSELCSEEQLLHRKLALHRNGWTQEKARKVVELTRALNGHAEDVLRWSLLHQVEDKERKQRERAGYKSRRAQLPEVFESDESDYLYEIAEGEEPGDGARPRHPLRFSTTPHDVAVAAVDWLLQQKPHYVTDGEWTYLGLRYAGLTRQEASVELGHAQGWGSRFEARMRSRLEPLRRSATGSRWESGGEVRRFRAMQYGSGPRMRPLPLFFESVPLLGNSQRNGEWIDAGPPGTSAAWGRPPRPETERRRDSYHMQLAETRHVVLVPWFTSFTSGMYERVVTPGEESAPFRPLEVEDICPVPSAYPHEIAKVVNMSDVDGDRGIEFGKWRVYAFECYPNGYREVWYSAQNGGPLVYAKTPQRLVEKMKAH